MSKLKLPNNPYEALAKIADFLDSAQYDDDHMFPPDANKREFTGYWQSVDFFYDLQGHAYEARRVAGHYPKVESNDPKSGLMLGHQAGSNTFSIVSSTTGTAVVIYMDDLPFLIASLKNLLEKGFENHAPQAK